ncbi:MAG: ATP-binding protein [Deltaproteobacteria bacterium]|nr:ATP-binding protein [Deltaproteobacteria bacterium]
MLDYSEYFGIQINLLRHVPKEHRRFLHHEIPWDDRLIGISGSRGTGKSTLLLQHLFDLEGAGQECLFLSADHIRVQATGLYELGSGFFQTGGKKLLIDEVHKYANWAQEIKNLYDSFPAAQIVFSGSSTMKLQLGKADLSRRAVYFSLPSLSLREYILLSGGQAFSAFSLSQLLSEHVNLAKDILKAGPILGHLKAFFDHGAYPFFLEGVGTYHARLVNVIEKILYEDIPSTTGMRFSGVPVLKKILFEIASSPPYQLNIDRLASDLQVSRPTVYNYLAYLEQAGLLKSVMPRGAGATLTRKPAKLFFENTNLIKAAGMELKLDDSTGTLRETFFASQVQNAGHAIRTPKHGDFLVDGDFVFEIGGKKKTSRQIAGQEHAFVVRDDIEIGSKNTIPLWLFGFLY